MKKVFIISTILLIIMSTCILSKFALQMEDVAAASCQVRWENKKPNIISDEIAKKLQNSTILNLNINGNLSFSTLNGKTALCLDAGKGITTNYVLADDQSLASNTNLRKAYAMAAKAFTNLNTKENVLRYMLAQLITWYETNNYSYNSTLLVRALRVIVQEFDDSWAAAIVDTLWLVSEFSVTPEYNGPLYVYKPAGCTDESKCDYQKFLSIDLNLGQCSSGGSGGSGNPTCSGYKVKIEPDPAVCDNSNETNIGTFRETVVRTTNCNEIDSNVDPNYGKFSRTLGSYAKLYCLEEVSQFYPGGISSPLSLGTNIVWPTSDATLKTVWGNLYSLKLYGTKKCTIKLVGSPKTKFDAFMESLNDKLYTTKNDEVRQNGGDCRNSEFATNLDEKESQKNKADQDVLDSQKSYNDALTNYNIASNNASGAKKFYDRCVDRCKNEKKCDSYTGQTKQNCLNSCSGTSTTSACKSEYNTWQKAKQTEENASSEKDQKEKQLKEAEKSQTKAQNELAVAQQAMTSCENYISNYKSALNVINDLMDAASFQPDLSNFYAFESTLNMSYNDKEFGKEYKLNGQSDGYTYYDIMGQAIPDVNYTFQNTQLKGGGSTSLQNIFNEVYNKVRGRSFSISTTVTYSLPSDGYRYINKKTNKPATRSDTLNDPTGNYINVGYTFLPTSYAADTSTKYDLTITVDSLGENGKFSLDAVQNGYTLDYTCHYSVTKTPTDECVCPDGTKHAGEDLYCKIKSSTQTTMTCANAQVLYCDDDSITFDDSCADDKFCPNDKSIKITSCVNSGHSYDYCVDMLCKSTPNNDYHCPKGTWNDGMDIKPCVFANIDMGLDDALQYCKDTVCPYKGGINIIYRTISLRNPFPGKNSTASKQTGITNNFSLDDIYGRYPGANWNSVTLVQNQILKNRGVDGNEVYNKTPLYSFELDPATIKEIRNYNKNASANGGAGYADFTLNCDVNGVKCLSSFIRDKAGLTGGTCSSGLRSDFDKCAES